MTTDDLLAGSATIRALDELRSALPDAAIATDAGTLDSFAHDAWPVAVVDARRGAHPHRPEAVVRARSEQDVVAVLSAAQRFGVPVTPRGLGSSVTGQALPVRGGIVLDLGLIVGEPVLDEVNRMVTAPAGTRAGDLEAWLNQRGRTLNNAPQSLLRSSIGGWVATRETGQLSSKYGGIEQLLVACTVVLASGERLEVGSRPRNAVGPDLRQLFLGSEGAFGVVLSVTLRVFADTGFVRTSAYSMPSVGAGLAVLRQLTQAGIRPALARFYDQSETQHAVPGADPDRCALFLGFDGQPLIANAEAQLCAQTVAKHGGNVLAGDPVGAWLGRRFDFSTVEGYLAERGGYAETIEVAHFWSGIEPLYDALRAALLPLADDVLMHFSHVYDQGVSLYAILLGHDTDDDDAAARLQTLWETAMTVTVEQGGEISHHHGAGLARQRWISESLGSQHQLIGRLKSALDPAGILNPGKLGL